MRFNIFPAYALKGSIVEIETDSPAELGAAVLDGIDRSPTGEVHIERTDDVTRIKKSPSESAT